jgi:hypothetical protein
MSNAWLYLFPSNSPLNHLHPTTTELPFLSMWEEEEKMSPHIILNMGALKNFSSPLFKFT